MSLFIDYHTHTQYCGHARGTMEQYVRRAVELGLEELGFSCHYPSPPGYDYPLPDCLIPRELFPVYLDEARRLRDEFAGRIRIRIGAEFDYLGPAVSCHPLETARGLGLDYCIASVHIVDEVVIDYTPEHLRAALQSYPGGIDRLCERYYECLAELAEPGCCSIIGHFDLVKKFNHQRDLRPARDLTAVVDRALDRIAASGAAIEINTSGWDKPCREQYPAEPILRRALARGIPITAGSDSHAPEEVGRHQPRLAELLKRLGIKELVGFEQRELRPRQL